MTTKQEVIKAFEANPESTSQQLAERLGCHDAYVRATLTRNGLSLKRSRRSERERCAQIAETLGSPVIAAAIRGDDMPEVPLS